MVASRATAKQVLDVLRLHVPEDAVLRVLRDLRDVRGNRSFTDTVERMREIMREEFVANETVLADELADENARRKNACEQLKDYLARQYKTVYSVGVVAGGLVAYSRVARRKPKNFPPTWNGFPVEWQYMGGIGAVTP